MSEKELGTNRPRTRTALRTERLPELRWPYNQYIYQEMMKNAKVAQVARAVSQPLARADWSVKANGAPTEIVEHVAGDLRLPIHGQEEHSAGRLNGRVSWSDHLRSATDAIFYGVAFFEQVYDVGPDGREHLVKLAPRPNTSIKRIVVADDGGLEGIVQDEVFIPVDRLVAYVYQPRDASWTGESLLRPAYAHWKEVTKLEALNSLVLQRNGLGVPMHKQSINTPDDEIDDAAEQGLEMATSFAAGEAAGGTLRPGEDLELKGISGSLVDIKPSIEYHNAMIAVAANATHLNLEGQGGSYALAETKTSEFFQQIQTIAEWLADTATQHIVEDLVRIAYPKYEGPTPQIVMTPVTAKKDLAPGDLAQLINAKLFTLEPNIEKWARQNYGIPEARPLVEALEAKKNLQEAEREAGVTLKDDAEEADKILSRYVTSIIDEDSAKARMNPEEG